MAVERFHDFDADTGIFTVGMVLHDIGDEVPLHAHAHGHSLRLITGGLEITADGVTEKAETRFSKTWIPAHVPHGIKATRPMTIAECLWILHWPDGRRMTADDAKGLTPFQLYQLTAAL